MSSPRIAVMRGVSLIELALILVVAGLLIVVALAVVPQLTERSRLNRSEAMIGEVREALVSFAANNWRLPCPDVNGDGLEGSAGTCAAGDVTGAVPYRSLGFPDPVRDAAHIRLRYSLYRNPDAAGNDADLAVLGNRYVPVLPGDPPTVDNDSDLLSEGLNPVRKVPDNRNDLDFCLALRNARSVPASTDFTHTLDNPNPPVNAAFVLAAGGVEDADGDGGDIAFDGVNEGPAQVGFESPARRRGIGYDDVVFAMPFDRLESRLSCAAITVGVSSAGNVAIAAALMVAQAEDLLWQAERATVMDDMAVAQAGFALAIAILQEIMIITDGIVAGVSASCPPIADNAAALVFIVAEGVAAAINIGLAAAALANAESQQALNDAVYAATQADLVNFLAFATLACTDAEAADQRGGQQ